MAPTTAPLQRSELKTERQQELMRILEGKFEDFAQRSQQFYPLLGMSTAHCVTSVIADITSLQAFWPKDQVPRPGVYELHPNTMEKVQDAIRNTLVQLAEKGHLERVGNEHERRWRPLGIVSRGRIEHKP